MSTPRPWEVRSAHGDVKTDKEAGRQRYKVYPTCSGVWPARGKGEEPCTVGFFWLEKHTQNDHQ